TCLHQGRQNSELSRAQTGAAEMRFKMLGYRAACAAKGGTCTIAADKEGRGHGRPVGVYPSFRSSGQVASAQTQAHPHRQIAPRISVASTGFSQSSQELERWWRFLSGNELETICRGIATSISPR